MRKILMVLFSIISLVLFFSCGDEEKSPEKKIINKEVVKSEETKSIEKKIYSFKSKNKIKLINEDFVEIEEQDNFIKVEFNKNNKNNYYINKSRSENNSILLFEKINIVSSLVNDLSYLNIVKIYYIEKSEYDNYEVNISDYSNEINIDNYNKKYNYNNISNIKILSNSKLNLININLLNTDFCNEYNAVYIGENKKNEKTINLINESVNNIICKKENILITKGEYIFSDKRNYNLFDNKNLVNKKINDLKNQLKNNFNIILSEDNNNYIIDVNSNIHQNNYSLNYLYREENKTFSLILNKINEKWLPIDRISINKSILEKSQKIEVLEDIINESKINSIKEEKDKVINAEKILFDNGKKYSFINDLKCNYFNNALEIEITDLDNKPNLIFTKKEKNNCVYYKTQKIAANIFDFNIKENEKYKLNLLHSKYLKIKRKSNKYQIEGVNNYNLYDYKILNNQLYFYVDKKQNDEYIIVNKEIETINIQEYNNINIIDLSLNKKLDKIIDKEYRVYRDYNESLKSNINIIEEGNQKYYTVRFNSIYLNEDYKKCTNGSYYIEKIKDNDSSFTYVIKNKKGKCKNIGIGLYIYKLIGDSIDIDFKNSLDNNLNEMIQSHDKQQYKLSNLTKNTFIDFDFDVIYHNDIRYFTFNFKNINKGSEFNNILDISLNGDNIDININETKEFLTNNNTFYKKIKTDKKIKNLNINLIELDGNKKHFLYKLIN